MQFCLVVLCFGLARAVVQLLESSECAPKCIVPRFCVKVENRTPLCSIVLDSNLKSVVSIFEGGSISVKADPEFSSATATIFDEGGVVEVRGSIGKKLARFSKDKNLARFSKEPESGDKKFSDGFELVGQRHGVRQRCGSSYGI
jgi:hypothetical protein